jgi:hypothetical protein
MAKDGSLEPYTSSSKQQWLLASCKPMGETNTNMDWREAKTKRPDFKPRRYKSRRVPSSGQYLSQRQNWNFLFILSTSTYGLFCLCWRSWPSPSSPLLRHVWTSKSCPLTCSPDLLLSTGSNLQWHWRISLDGPHHEWLPEHPEHPENPKQDLLHRHAI